MDWSIVVLKGTSVLTPKDQIITWDCNESHGILHCLVMVWADQSNTRKDGFQAIVGLSETFMVTVRDQRVYSSCQWVVSSIISSLFISASIRGLDFHPSIHPSSISTCAHHHGFYRIDHNRSIFSDADTIFLVQPFCMLWEDRLLEYNCGRLMIDSSYLNPGYCIMVRDNVNHKPFLSSNFC